MSARINSTLIYDKIQEPGFPFAHCSNLTQISDKFLMAQWYSGKAEQSKNQSLFAAFFDLSKKKWSAPFLLSKSTEYPDGNGVIWKHPELDKLFLFYATIWTNSPFKKALGRGWFYCKLFYKTSAKIDDRLLNGNQSNDPITDSVWYAPNSLSKLIQWNETRVMRDELGWMFRNKPILLEHPEVKGRIIVPMYQEVPPRGLMAISDDNGESFKFSSLIGNHEKYSEFESKNTGFMAKITGGFGNTQPTVVELKNGKIIALLRTRMNSKIFRSESSDHGFSWSLAEEINLPNPDSGIDMIKLANGKLLLIYNHALKGRHNLSLALSTDEEGKNFEQIKVLEQHDKMKFSYPAIINVKNGSKNEIHATYTYNRKTIKHIWFFEEDILDNSQ